MAKLRDIAIRAGVTVSTVSKVLNHSNEISPTTARRVMEVAKELGYVAKKSVNWKEKTIGVILPEVQSLYYAGLLQRLGQEIEKYGYVMLTMLTSGYAESIKPFMERMYQYKPEGLIICCTSLCAEEDCHLIEGSGIPTMILNESSISFPIDSI